MTHLIYVKLHVERTKVLWVVFRNVFDQTNRYKEMTLTQLERIETELYSMRTDITSTTATTNSSRNFLPVRAGDVDYTRSAGGETGCFWSISLSAATYPQWRHNIPNHTVAWWLDRSRETMSWLFGVVSRNYVPPPLAVLENIKERIRRAVENVYCEMLESV